MTIEEFNNIWGKAYKAGYDAAIAEQVYGRRVMTIKTGGDINIPDTPVMPVEPATTRSPWYKEVTC